MKKLLLLTLLLCAGLQAWADTWNDSNGISWIYTVSGTNATNIMPTYKSSISGDLVIPSIVNGYTVTSIGNNAFEGCTGLKSVTIPSSVTSIGYYAFRGCTGLTSVTIPEGVTSIGGGAFYGCTGLDSVKVTVTDMSAFCNNQVVGQIRNYFYNPVTLIDSEGNEITDYVIPEGVTSIGSSAFSGCDGLTSVTIPEGVTSIGNSAFSGCSRLTSVTIPSSVTSIGYEAFRGCDGLTNVTIPEGVTSIGNNAFWGCI